ncbi:P-loop containing nucleoside triphosphate hydrolase protein [Thozetella sp. PMI_491]|nr:P-loop containing nucleoside triphosphate hydrolase protein [Thozetella sp. PMI_491]
MDSDTPPEYPFQLLLPPKIWGFGLHDKKWRTLHVEYIRPVTWNKKAFEQLVLDPQKKELIEAMVRIHMSSTMSTDVIEGKGNGLIILLHGGPGTGKTLTAESVAELAEKPLYRVTCGDIGTDPESVERYLESVLYIGSIWKAVVLLDESDVFLEQREKTDLQRNALVSVFLRILEYYEGILILTSNRVGIFDEAFKSRVQLALHYPPLSEDDRWKIWDNFINQLDEQQEAGDSAEDESTTSKLADGEKINTKELRSKINVLARENINGRQIRNAITTARQLALHRHQPLGYAHLDQTIRVAKEFEDYVTKTQGYRAAEYVRAEGLRFE